VETMTTHLEDLFESVGDLFEDDLITKIIKSATSSPTELEDAGAKKSEEKSKNDKKDSDKSVKKEHFKSFIEAIEKENYHVAVIELLELGAKMKQLDKNADYFALLTFCFVAIRKYYQAEFADKLARQYDSDWEKIFDNLSDAVYDSGLFFMAESLRQDVRALALEATMKELEWEKDDIFMLTKDLASIFKLENEKLAKTITEEKFSPAIDDKSTLDDVVIALCDEFILPFYARLELQKLVGRYKDDDTVKSSKSKKESRK